MPIQFDPEVANTCLARSTPAHTIAVAASGTSDEEPPIVTNDHQAKLPSAASGARWGRFFHSLEVPDKCTSDRFSIASK